MIENVWQVSKRKAAAHKPTSEAHLSTLLKEVWVKEISPDYCRSLVCSIPDRIRAILPNKRYPTKYSIFITFIDCGCFETVFYVI